MENNSPEQIDKDGCGLKPLIPLAFALCIKKEYDFFKGEIGTFCRPDAELHLPIYLERNTMEVGSGLRRLSFIAISTDYFTASFFVVFFTQTVLLIPVGAFRFIHPTVGWALPTMKIARLVHY